MIIGVPAAVSGVVVIVTKLGATLILISSVLAFWLGLSKEETQLNQKHLNFEIDDALKKLERLELVTREGDVLQCRPLAEAKRRLDHIWDNYFRFNHS